MKKMLGKTKGFHSIMETTMKCPISSLILSTSMKSISSDSRYILPSIKRPRFRTKVNRLDSRARTYTYVCVNIYIYIDARKVRESPRGVTTRDYFLHSECLKDGGESSCDVRDEARAAGATRRAYTGMLLSFGKTYLLTFPALLFSFPSLADLPVPDQCWSYSTASGVALSAGGALIPSLCVLSSRFLEPVCYRNNCAFNGCMV